MLWFLKPNGHFSLRRGGGWSAISGFCRCISGTSLGFFQFPIDRKNECLSALEGEIRTSTVRLTILDDYAEFVKLAKGKYWQSLTKDALWRMANSGGGVVIASDKLEEITENSGRSG